MSELDSDLIAKAKFAFKRSRLRALDQQPFFGTIGMGLGVEICESHMGRPIRTCATDGLNVYVNPTYFLNLPELPSPGQKFSEREAVVVHEFGHPAFGHNLRRGNRDQGLWNIACDHALDLILKDAGYWMENWLCDEKYRGWSAEKIYDDLAKDDGGGGGHPGKPGDDDEEEAGSSTVQSNEPEEDSKVEPGIPSDENSPGQDDSNVADTQPRPSGEVWDQTDGDGNELDEEGREEARRQHADNVSRAKTAAGGTESIAGLDREVKKIVAPTADWESIVSNFWNSGGGEPYGTTWTRFDRRSMMVGLWNPSVVRGGLDWVAIGFDVSYSMSQDEYDAGVALINSLRESVEAERITVIPFNSRVNQDKIIEIGPEEEVPSHFDVGGGTRFAPVFNWINRQNDTPDFCIMFTDLGSHFEEEPEYPVLWASTVPIWEGINEPPFGEAVEIEL